MGQLHMTGGQALPLIVDDFYLEDISGEAFDPMTTLHDADHVHPTVMDVRHAYGLYGKNGFLVRPNADGDLWVVTWRQLQNAVRRSATIAEKVVALADIEPKCFNGKENEWVETPIVKVFGGDGDGTGHYVSVATEIITGIIL